MLKKIALKLSVQETSTPLLHLVKIWGQIDIKCVLSIFLYLWRSKLFLLETGSTLSFWQQWLIYIFKSIFLLYCFLLYFSFLLLFLLMFFWFLFFLKIHFYISYFIASFFIFLFLIFFFFYFIFLFDRERWTIIDPRIILKTILILLSTNLAANLILSIIKMMGIGNLLNFTKHIFSHAKYHKT